MQLAMMICLSERWMPIPDRLFVWNREFSTRTLSDPLALLGPCRRGGVRGSAGACSRGAIAAIDHQVLGPGLHLDAVGAARRAA